HRDAGLRPRLCRVDPGRPVRDDRGGRPPSRARAADGVRRPGHRLPGGAAPMMFVVRTTGPAPAADGIAVKLARRTPAIVAEGPTTDYFCVGEPAARDALRAAGRPVVELRDGWYADDTGGGVAIWGQGQYWEVRDTPFRVKEAVGPSG